ncbi:MAG: cytochrome c3 family protein [Planctomycetota bacterium]
MQEFHFPNWVNRFTLLLLGGGAAIGGYLATCLFAAIHPTVVNVGHMPTQPVPFSHKLHAGQLKLDCRYCHNTVERAGHAAIPPTATCGNCHGGDRVKPGETLGVIWPDSSNLEPVRLSLETGDPIEWDRVHDLPDFVYFNHSVHIARGVSCVSCHGRVDKMEVVRQMEPLSMKWCLDCHRNPEPHIRDPELVTQLDFEPEDADGDGEPDWEAYGAEWAETLNINTNISCSTCHR